MVTFLLWLVLLVFCWPIALLALVLYPIVWLVLLPFRLIGVAFDGVFELLRALLLLPSRVLGARELASLQPGGCRVRFADALDLDTSIALEVLVESAR